MEPEKHEQLRLSYLSLGSSSSSSSSSTNNNQHRQSSLLPLPVSNVSSPNKRKAMKKTPNTSRRRSSLSYIPTNDRRGLSDMALVSSNMASGMSSHPTKPNNRKRLRRSISWDVRPPKVHELKRCSGKGTASLGKDSPEDADGGGGKNEAWYSKEEYSDIIKEQMNSIMIMRYLRECGTDETELDPELYCERGLESYQSKERRHEIDTKRKLHRLLVIQEQARQASLGTKDPELLRKMASTQSEGSLMKAQLRAALDHHEASQTDQKPMSEQEKLQIALEQHNRMIQERIKHKLEDNIIDLCHEKTPAKDSRVEASETDDPTNGIISLASLWAQDCTSFASEEPQGSRRMEDDSANSAEFFVDPSASLYSQSNGQQRQFKKSPNPNQGMPLVGFHSMYQPSSFLSKPSAPVMSPQVIHNALRSSQAYSADFGYSLHQHHQQQRNGLQSRGTNNNNNTHIHPHLASMMPTSAFAAMNIHHQQQHDTSPNQQR
ncbi:hypothetical protein IV203_025696 [Nitzschia inconspicua]|uniref:Uncharacterized protein n=1 Tax=Nitzschia inconspicua TaxID=303405 RepID=A0A9K3LGN3_9STRA|nr:hypothetical protein IV203_025696 [Nitzschia inconspicua]